EKCEAQIEAAKSERASMTHLERKALFASDVSPGGPASGELTVLARAVLSRLRSPATIDDVLEELPSPDADILAAIRELDTAGRVKLLAQEGERVPLVNPEGLHSMRAHAARGKSSGFEGAARVVFAGTPGRLAVATHSALGLADAVPAPDAQPTVPAPYLM